MTHLGLGSSRCSRCGEPPADHSFCQECESWICADTPYEWESHKQGCTANLELEESE